MLHNAPVNGLSVPFCLVILYCSSVNSAFHSALLFSTRLSGIIQNGLPDISIKRLIGEKAVEFAKYLKTAQIDGFVGGAKVGDAITKLVAEGVDGLPAFGQTIATYSGENIQGSVSKNLQQKVD